jgi:mono/diheme cytochrome c family protein
LGRPGGASHYGIQKTGFTIDPLFRSVFDEHVVVINWLKPMKKETLARFLVVFFFIIAVSIPFAGQWWYTRNLGDPIELHARMPENGGWSLNTIQAQVGQPIYLHITSDDVVHGFAIAKSDQPALEIMPGEFVDTTLTFDKPGTYTYYCTRWCGPNHWRMRGTIEVTGTGKPLALDPQPLYIKLGIDIDSPQQAKVVSFSPASAEHGAQFAKLLPAYATQRDTYLSTSPSQLWSQLRAEQTQSSLSDQDLWDAVAWIWQHQTSPEAVADGQKLFSANCAACHGEKGQGNGVMVRRKPVWNPGSSTAGGMSPSSTGEGIFSPPDFTDPKNLLGAGPALLEGKIIRGGMGTGMPYWGPIFTSQQIESLVSYLYHFAWNPSPTE